MRPLGSDRTRNNSSQTVTDQVNLLPGRSGQRLLKGVIQLSPDQKVGTLSVETYA